MKKKNVQAFTLMELLAVLVILAIIALIVFPIIGDVITDSKMKAFKSSVDGLEHAVDLDYQKDYYTGVREYMYSDGELTLLTVKDKQKMDNIKVEGIIEDGIGFISVDKDGNTSLAIHNGEWCATKEVSDKIITIEEKTEDNCNVETPAYCFEVEETNLESFDINLENCLAYLNKDEWWHEQSEENKRHHCTKGAATNLSLEYPSLETLIDMSGGENIEELIENKVIENVTYKEGLIITDYYCTDGNEYGYETITDVVIPSKIDNKPILKIGTHAMYYGNLTSVIINNNNNNNNIKILEKAFADNNITKIILGNNIQSIGPYAFAWNDLTSVTIPNNIQAIGDGAFSGNSLSSITIPDSVTTIGGYAFFNNKLTSITIPNSVTTIKNGAFSSNNLMSITIPSTVTTIGGGAFNDNQLSDEYAFIYRRNSDGSVDKTTLASYGGAKRDNVIIPNNVITIGEYAFDEIDLTSITIPDSVTAIGYAAFSSNDLTSIIIPDNVTTIGNYAFMATPLTSITIPDSVTTIGDGAFYNSDLASVTLGNNVTTIGNESFVNNKLTSVILPDSVTTIGEQAFSHNDLRIITIPSNVTTIGWAAFNKGNFSNEKLTKIVNKTGRAFDWNGITGGSSSETFITGTISGFKENITVSSN